MSERAVSGVRIEYITLVISCCEHAASTREEEGYRLVRPSWFSLRPSELEGRAAAGSLMVLGMKSGSPIPGKATSLSLVLAEEEVAVEDGVAGASLAPLKTAQTDPEGVVTIPKPPRVVDSRRRLSRWPELPIHA